MEGKGDSRVTNGGGYPQDESFAAGLESNIQIGADQRAPGTTSLIKRNCKLFRFDYVENCIKRWFAAILKK